MADSAKRRSNRASVVLLVASLACVAAACSSSSDIATSRQPTSTVRIAPDDAIGNGDGLTNGSEAIRQIQAMVDKLSQSTDPCGVLTGRDVKGIKLDPTAMASGEARKVVSQGVVKIYNHLVQISDPAIKDALRVQRDTYSQILDVVDRFAAAASSKQGNDEIQALAATPQFLAAQQQVAAWTTTHCG